MEHLEIIKVQTASDADERRAVETVARIARQFAGRMPGAVRLYHAADGCGDVLVLLAWPGGEGAPSRLAASVARELSDCGLVVRSSWVFRLDVPIPRAEHAAEPEQYEEDG